MDKTNARIISTLFFRLLPVQIILAAINALNGLISGLFASNFAGDNALSAVGLYSPINMFVTAIGIILLGGSQILLGKHMARHELDRMRAVFSLDILAVTIASAILIVLFLVGGIADLTVFMTPDTSVRLVFNRYLIGQAIGIFPYLMGLQIFAFLAMELQNRRTTIASISFVVVNLILNYLFVAVLKMEAFGLALATAGANWFFLAILASYYFTGKSILRFQFASIRINDLKDIIKIGLPGALVTFYQFFRGIIVNGLITKYVGSDGLSAFAASNSLLGIVWAVPTGIQAVASTLFSVHVGEEDRTSLANIMRTVVYKCIPGMCIIVCAVVALAVPFTSLFYRDSSTDVFQMTVNAFRILPLCMPFSVFCMNYVCYGQAIGKTAIVYINTLFDGLICVAGFTALLITSMGMNSVYWANVLNGVVTVLIFVIYSIVYNRRFPRNMEELMAIPAGFGVPDKDRLDISIQSEDAIVELSESVHSFCLEHGVNERKAYFAALCMEEMAGNIVQHGFSKDNKNHSVDIRVSYKSGTVLLRIKDDCVPFDPAERRNIVYTDDICKNIGIRMVYRIADDIDYQHILGLNVLTMKFTAN